MKIHGRKFIPGVVFSLVDVFENFPMAPEAEDWTYKAEGNVGLVIANSKVSVIQVNR